MRLNIDTGVIVSVASSPPSLSFLQEVIRDLEGECHVCLGMVPEGCQAGHGPQILGLSAESGI